MRRKNSEKYKIVYTYLRLGKEFEDYIRSKITKKFLFFDFTNNGELCFDNKEEIKENLFTYDIKSLTKENQEKVEELEFDKCFYLDNFL